jgi:hypothetical protein
MLSSEPNFGGITGRRLRHHPTALQLEEPLKLGYSSYYEKGQYYGSEEQSQCID